MKSVGGMVERNGSTRENPLKRVLFSPQIQSRPCRELNQDHLDGRPTH